MSGRVTAVAVLSCRAVGADHRDRENTRIGAEVVALHPLNYRPPPGQYVLFIHGYNATAARASLGYAKFRSWLEEFGAHANVIEFHWPGNEHLFGQSELSYPSKVHLAREVGPRLAQWVRQAGPGVSFVIVTHSLGGRVLLEMINDLRQRGGIHRVRGACLMAAAVPAIHIQPGSAGLGPRPAEPLQWRILYSPGDSALGWKFRIGQWKARDGVGSPAVGLYGNPDGAWHDRWGVYRYSDRETVNYDHGWYWSGGPDNEKAPPSREACPLPNRRGKHSNDGESALIVAAFLGAAVPRKLPRRINPVLLPPEERRIDERDETVTAWQPGMLRAFD